MLFYLKMQEWHSLSKEKNRYFIDSSQQHFRSLSLGSQNQND